MSHRLITPPATSVLTTDELKSQARITHASEDTYLADLIDRATRHIENTIRRALITQTWKLALDRFPACIYVPRPPLIAVSSITYLDTDGIEQTLDAADYRVDTQRHPGRIKPAYGESWPTTRDVMAAIAITHTAGYGAAGDVPDDLKHAICLLAAHWYENREAVLVGSISRQIEFAVDALCDPYVVESYG